MEKVFIANWKMELSAHASVELAREIDHGLPATAFTGDVVLCPSFPMLGPVAGALQRALLGAQDCGWQPRGAFTGVVSAAVLKEIGCRFVIVGHSERRRYCGETEAIIAEKIRQCIAAQLTPILCVGESADERRAGRRNTVLFQQVTTALGDCSFDERANRLIIAYEPVWVIGRGQAVEPADIREAREVIHSALKERYGSDKIARAFRLVYGGSVEPGNIAGIVSGSGMDGVLVGSASLKAPQVLAMVSAIA